MGLVIGDKARRPEEVVVFLHLGHSNMAGRTNSPDAMRPYYFETHPQLWAYGGMEDGFRPAKEPLSEDYLTRGRAGPGMAMLRAGLERAPEKLMVSIGHGHDGSRGGYCKSYRKGGLLYDFVMKPAMELRGKVTFGAIFVMLGVNEFRRDFDNLPRFHACLEGIAAEMRADLGEPDLPFLMGDWEAGARGAFDPSRDYAVVTREQLRIANQNIPRSGLIATDGLPMADDHHYDLEGYKLWVERGFAILSQGGWLPWATAAPAAE